MLNTGETEAEAILRARVAELFELPYKNFIVKLDDLSENDDYFIANYGGKEKFDLGHLAGAVNYAPGASMASTSDLYTLPTDQKIVVYGDTGLESAYIVAYLKNHPKIHQGMTFLVRHLEPTKHGLPVQIYVFSNDQAWANYEAIQADIFDHLLAAAPEFGLRIYQSPSGYDFRDWQQSSDSA